MLAQVKKLGLKQVLLASIGGVLLATASAPVAMAQNAAQNQAAIFQLQEQIRLLNGRVEEMTFQVLELQELLRQTREANESRFLELEEGGDGQDDFSSNEAETSPLKPEETVDTALQSSKPSPITDNAADLASTGALDAQGNTGLGRPLDLGSVTLDLHSGDIGLDATTTDSVAGTIAETAPPAGELYQRGYSHVMRGNYGAAEEDFRQLVKAYPEAEQVADASYWLGESLFAQGDFNDAAEAYLNVVNSHPQANLAPDAMLKLGIALMGMGQTSIACDTFEEVASRYPQTPGFFKQRLQREKSSASCS